MKYFSTILALVLIGLEGRCQTLDAKELDSFWKQLIYNLTVHDSIAVSDLIHFPLKNAQILVGRYNEAGLTREEFLNNHHKLFTTELIDQIVGSDLNDLSRSKSKDNEFVFARTFSSNDQQTKYSIALFISKVKHNYRLTRIEFAG